MGYLKDVSEVGGSIGLGFPLGKRGTAIDLAIQGGVRSSNRMLISMRLLLNCENRAHGNRSLGQPALRHVKERSFRWL